MYSQLALPLDTFHQSSPVTQDDLAVDFGHEPDLLPAIFDLASSPHLGDEFLGWFDRGREPGLEFLHVGRVATSELLEQGVRCRVPAEEAVHDGAAEAHFLAGFGRGMEWVVVAVQSV